MPIDYQYIIALVIVAAAAVLLWRNLRGGQKTDSCGSCPLKDECQSTISKKNRQNTCKNKK